MRHHQTFTIEVEAFIVHKDDISHRLFNDGEQLPWRACVRNGKQMEWQWCFTEDDAKNWIESWKTKLIPLE